jgi:anti-sigma regulatory factor (Ser/Thr protein kinase)
VPIELAGDESGQYKIEIPMSQDAELIAAHVIDDVGRRNGVPTKIRNQVKTAVVEACINAAEHSLSPDGRIAIEFAFEPSLIAIRIANRGIRLLDRPRNSQSEKRRGWGLNLMKKLMDEVTIEPTDDGTILTMRKILPLAESDTS